MDPHPRARPLGARLRLLWKPRQRTITLLTAVWRAGARCLQFHLRTWVETWRDHGDAGGLCNTSVQSALMQVQQAFCRQTSHVLQMDISAYFDSICHETLRRTLHHLRFPQQPLDLLCNFYSHSDERSVGRSDHRHSSVMPAVAFDFCCDCPCLAVLQCWGPLLWSGCWASIP